MWHLLKKYNRVVARNVTEEEAQRLLSNGGEVSKDHKPPAPNLVGYVINEKPIFSYAQIIIEADGKEIARVTRKQDAFAIMQALKRDYKDIYVKFK